MTGFDGVRNCYDRNRQLRMQPALRHLPCRRTQSRELPYELAPERYAATDAGFWVTPNRWPVPRRGATPYDHQSAGIGERDPVTIAVDRETHWLDSRLDRA